MESKKSLKKISKSKKIVLIVGIIIVIVGLFGGGILSYLISIEKPSNLSQEDESGQYVEINVDLVTSYFATLTTDNSLEKYYFITSDDKLYIAKLDDETFSKLEANYDYNYSTDENAVAPDAVAITGFTDHIPDEIKTFAIEYFSESEGLELSTQEFDELVYPLLLDTYQTKTDSIMNITVIFGVTTVVGLILIMIYMNSTSKTKKSLNKYKKELNVIEDELNNNSTIHNELCKVYISDNYIVSYNDVLKIIRLSDVVWLYPFEYRQKGVVTQKSVYIITKDGTKNIVGNINSWSKNKEESYNELYQTLLRKTPDALHGYSKDNKEKMQRYTKK